MNLVRDKFWCGSAALLICVGLILSGASKPDKLITLADAKAVVREGLVHGRSKIALTQYGYPEDRNFYFFEGSWDNKTGSMIAGHYAVDVHDATLWLVEGSVCTKLETRSVAQAQRNARRHLSLNVGIAKHSANLKPVVCQDD